MSETQPLLETAISAIKDGQPKVARVLLEQVLAHDERNEQAWLWLAAVVETEQERQLCFDNVLAINPNNPAARQRIAPAPRPFPRKWAMVSLLGLALLVVGLVGLALNKSSSQPLSSSEPDPVVQPTPPVLHPGWTNFTNGNDVLNLHLQGETLWAATSGGLVRWDTSEGSYLKYTSEHGLPGNHVRWVGASTDGRLLINVDPYRFYVGDGQSWEPLPEPDEQGIPRSEIFLQDSQGNLWLGHRTLARFDGQSWEWFEDLIPDTSGGSNRANVIFEDRQGNVWVGAQQALLRYDGQDWQTWTADDGLDVVSILDIAQEHGGALLLGTTDGILRFDPAGQTWEAFETTRGLPGETIVHVFVDRDGKVWAGVRYEIEKRTGQRTIRTLVVSLVGYDGSRWRAVPGLAEQQLTDVVQDEAGNLWVGTSGGLFRFDGVEWRPWRTEDELAGNFVTSMAVDHDDQLWFGATNGVSVLSASPGAAWQTIPGAGSAFTPFALTEIFVDREGNVWVSSWESLVTWFDGENWHEFSQADVASGSLDGVLEIFQNNDGQMWFISWSDQATEYDGESWRVIPGLENVGDDGPRWFVRDAAGDVWGLKSKQLWRYDGQGWETSPMPGGHYGGRLFLGPEGALWLAAGQSSIWRYAGLDWQAVDVPPGGPEKFDNRLFFDSAGGMWLVSQHELWRYAGEAWRHFNPADSGLACLAITEMLQDAQGDLWIATSEGGVSRLALDELE
jgi:ligand-binding sensor domain-containing protein